MEGRRDGGTEGRREGGSNRMDGRIDLIREHKRERELKELVSAWVDGWVGG